MDADARWHTAVAQLGRTSLLGVTFTFTLLGMASAGQPVSAWDILLALAGATAFHLAVYAWNDLVDLPIDRTEPRRAASPLVRGTVAPRQLAAVAAVAAAAALAVSLAAGIEALASMAAALGLLLGYDLWGKRCPVPPATDLVQGLGWAALVWFGAAAAGSPTAATVWIGAYVVVAILLVNGVHGAVRDLANDQRHGARTTARFLGADVDAAGHVRLPAALWCYGVVLHLGDVAIVVAALVATGAGGPLRCALTVATGAACLALLCTGLARAGTAPASWRAGFTYIVLMLLLPVLVVADHLRGALLGALLVLSAVPWAASRWVRASVRSLAASRRGEVSP